MTYAELQQRLKDMEIKVPDVPRAALYYRYLLQARTFLFDKMSDETDEKYIANYRFVERAVRKPELLSQLAGILDYFIGSPLNRAMRDTISDGETNWTYREYFDNTCFGDEFEQNVEDFFDDCPIALNAMEKSTGNFQENIRTACVRIIRDEILLRDFFRYIYPQLQFFWLDTIKLSGSDSHKGGQQVLFLTFEGEYYLPDNSLSYDPIRIVYKPGDLEIDCMITGNSKAVLGVLPQFPYFKSLAEIMNTKIQANTLGLKNLKPLTTYLILPRNPVSQNLDNKDLPLRQAYGYMEYLNYDMTGLGSIWNVLGLYPWAESDYMIFKSQNKTRLTRDFYLIMGQWLAVSCSLSLTDLHMENVRVRKYLPYLIDLENSLVENIVDVTKTMLITANMGGINGVQNTDPPEVWQVHNANVKGQAYMTLERTPMKSSENRLRYITNTEEVIPLDETALVTGFINGMRLLRLSAKDNGLKSWFKRAQKVMVRYLAYGTKSMRNLRDYIYIKTFEDENSLGTDLMNCLRKKLQEDITSYYLAYDPGEESRPDFLVLRTNIVGTDIVNLDVPVFYHLVGTDWIVNSNGKKVDIPKKITTDQGRKTVLLDDNNRTTFFSKPPVESVKRLQIDILKNDQLFDERVETLVEQIKSKLAYYKPKKV